MPTIRYEIKNEYGLGSRELYGAAEKGDTEAILEGVAMAGLTGLLRQLGDLAELAAQVFHDLQDEVLNTASRGHGLVLRLQQVEAELPSMEKSFIAQTTYSHFSYIEGMKWHCSLQVDQNVITAGQLPGFVMDSYKECHGPPKLYMLDKFDVAGSGACLKRFSDPSFYRRGLTSSSLAEEEARKENRTRNIWKVVQSSNDETPKSSSTPKNNSILQTSVSEKDLSEVSAKRVKLKSRELNRTAYSLRDHMEHLFRIHPRERKLLSESSLSHSIRSINSYESATGISGSIVDASADSEGSQNSSPTNQKMTDFHSHEFDRHSLESNSFNESLAEPSIEVPNASATEVHAAYAIVKKKETFYNCRKKTKGHEDDYWPSEVNSDPSTPVEIDQNGFLADAESRTEESSDGYISDEIASQTDNYMDALTTMESEIETDADYRTKRDLRFYGGKSPGMDSDTTEEKLGLHAQLSKLSHQMDPSSPGFSNLFRKGATDPSFSDTLGNLAAQLLEGHRAGSTSPIVSAFSSTETSIKKLKQKRHALERKYSENSVSSVASMRKEKVSDIPTSRSTWEEGPSGYSSQGSSHEIPSDSSVNELPHNLAQVGDIIEEEFKEQEILNYSKQLNGSSLHHVNLADNVLVADLSASGNDVHSKDSMRYPGSETIITSSRQDGKHKNELSVEQFERFSFDEDNTQSRKKPNMHLVVDNDQFDKLDAPQPNKTLTDQFPSEEHVLLQSRSKQSNLVSKSTETKALNSSDQSFVSAETTIRQPSIHFSGELVKRSQIPDNNDLSRDNEEIVESSGTQLQHGPDQATSSLKKQLSQELLATLGDTALSAETLEPLQSLGKEMQPVNSIEVPIVVNQHNELHSDGTMVNPPIVSSLEDYNDEYNVEAFGQGIMQTRGTLPELDNKSSQDVPISLKDNLQHLTSSGLTHSLKYDSSQLEHSLPNSEIEKSEDDASTSSREIMQRSSLIFAAANMEDEKDKSKRIPAASYAGLPPLPRKPKNVKHDITTKDDSSSNIENEKPAEEPDSSLNPARDALIEAVASHDKTKLRKIPELIQPSCMPNEDERGSFLEQIKNKSFVLKPTEVPKIKFKSGPPTNLKVIAILEKANAIRQACAGSDDDDDGDSWSDS